MCSKHPGKTYTVGNGGDVCISCAGLKATTRCGYCRKGTMGKGEAHCSVCSRDAVDADTIAINNTLHYLVPARFDLRREFLWRARDLVERLENTDLPVAHKAARMIRVKVLYPVRDR